MNARSTVKVLLPLAALCISALGTSVAYAQSLPPERAAMLNAGTAHTGVGLSGQVGDGISAVTPNTTADGVEVAGVRIGYVTHEAGSPAVSTLGDPYEAAALNAGTARTGLGPNGQVGAGIAGATGDTTEVAGVQTRFADVEGGYLSRLRMWNSDGYRVQPNHIHFFSLDRELVYEDFFYSPSSGIEVAGVQLGSVTADEAPTYLDRIREHGTAGFRIQPGFVNVSALVNR